MKRHVASDYEQLVKQVLRDQPDPEDTALFFYDIRILHDRVQLVRQAFPPDTRHAVSIKTNPVTAVLRACYGAGLQAEAASYSEYRQASRLPGFGQIAYDSPAKSPLELQEIARDPRVTINADSLEEIAHLPRNPSARIGLRINPQVSINADASMNVAGTYSKFGIPISRRSEIIRAFEKHSFLTGLHVHTGSQANSYDEMIKGIRIVLDLYREMGSALGKKIKWIDIGGGFPVDYGPETTHRISAYGQMLQDRCPELWSDRIEVITEFGRYYHAHAGFSLALVQGVKTFSDRQVLITHLGADAFVRESYNRKKWPHQFFAMDAEGNLKQGEKMVTDLGGPLCFGDDFYGKDVMLPAVEAGDWILIADTGANTYSLWSHHCSRPFPKLMIVDENGQVTVGKDRQDIRDTLRFWD